MDRTEALATLRRGLEQLTTDEAFQKYLRSRAAFHSYSMRNCLLIGMQNPDATNVAGFNTWKKLGRFVKKGEKGIAILAPLMYAKKDEGTGETTGQALMGFRVVHVFDVAQTDGQPLPERIMPKELTGDEGGDIFDAMKDFAEHGGLTVLPDYASFDDERKGDYSRGEKQIRIRAGMPMVQKCKTLAHECAHWVLHSSEEGISLSREAKETEAEAAAFLALAEFGIPTDGYSFAYIADWAGGDMKIMERSLSRIQKASDEIAHAIRARIGQEVTA